VLTSNRDVYVSSLDASGKPTGKPSAVMHQALGSAEFPVWSRDGQYLAYIVQTPPALDAQAVALPGSRTAIGIRVAATGIVRELPLPVSLEYPRPQWAADGGALIMLVREKGRGSFYRVDIQTGTPALLFRPSGFVTEFQMNPDGKSITYKEARASADGAATRAIVARDLVSGTERQLYSRAPGDGAFWGLSISPDGATLAFAQGKDIVVLPTAGGPPRTLSNIAVSQPGGISWSGDGRSLYVAAALSGEPGPGEPTDEIMRVSIADGRAEKLNVAGEGLTRLSVDRGGRWMAYVAGRPRGEIWKMERIPVGRAAARESIR
jgi:Tol biopolymer transport system component